MINITHAYLDDHPEHVFVFGDNLQRRGRGGAAALRDHDNAYGFITKKAPNNHPDSFYTPEEYWPVYQQEIERFREYYWENQNVKKFLISALGGGLADKYGIFEQVIHPNLRKDLKDLDRIVYLF